MLDCLDLLGVPFKVHGRNKEEGFDCYGLLIELAKRQGVTFQDAFYSDIKDKNIYYNFLKEKLPVEKIDNLEENCILLMLKDNNFSHVGVYLGEGKFIHATENKGVCISKLDHNNNKIKGLYRIKRNGNN